jgi:DNA-binding NtrC family response regulator
MVKKYNILYIDDEESNLRIFKNTFRRDFNIYLASSAADGLNILNETEIDVLITDQRMPNITGLELLKEVHKLFPAIPPHRLMVSGYAQPDDINTAYEQYGLFKFISKPWEAETLKQTILKVIQMKYE